MKKAVDPRQLSLLNEIEGMIPKPVPHTPGSVSLHGRIAEVITSAIEVSGLSREQVAEGISRLTGAHFGRHMLDAFAAPSRPGHNISLEKAIAFDAVTGGRALLNLHAAHLGCAAVDQRDFARAELGRIAQLTEELAEKRKALLTYLRSAV